MVNKKVAISVLVIAVMLIASNKGVSAYADIVRKNVSITTCYVTEAEKAQAEATAEAARAAAEAEKAQAETIAAAARAVAEAEKAQAEAIAAAARAAAEAEKAQAEAIAAAARAAAEAEKAQPKVIATAAGSTTEAEKAQAEAIAAAVQAAAAAERAQTEAAAAAIAAAQAAAMAGQYGIGAGTDTKPVVPILSTKVVNPENGDVIETAFDTVSKETITNIISARKDAPDTRTVTSPSGTNAIITGDGDSFNCNVGFYGNAISPVSLTAEYKTSIEIQLKNSSVMTGEINNNNKVQYVSLTLDSSSKWVVEGTSYLTAFINADTTLANIIDNGNTIYYNSSDIANDWLEGKSYTLSGGGKLIPIN